MFTVTYVGSNQPSDPNKVESNGYTFKINVPTTIESEQLARFLDHNPNFRVEGLVEGTKPYVAPVLAKPASQITPATGSADLSALKAESDRLQLLSDELDDEKGRLAEHETELARKGGELQKAHASVLESDAALRKLADTLDRRTKLLDQREADLTAREEALTAPAAPTAAAPAAEAKPAPLKLPAKK
jgi:hypothetical protein